MVTKNVLRNVQCSETYEETIFWFLRFLFFAKWSILCWPFRPLHIHFSETSVQTKNQFTLRLKSRIIRFFFMHSYIQVTGDACNLSWINAKYLFNLQPIVFVWKIYIFINSANFLISNLLLFPFTTIRTIR